MQSQQNKYQLVAALGLLSQGDTAARLADYLGETFRPHLQTEMEGWLKMEPASREALLAQFLKTVRSQEEFSGIADIHPAWLLEPLKKESPRVIGILLRNIPSKHVRYILEHLPRSTVDQLPKLVESFFVPKEILSLIRRRFERNFLPLHTSRTLKAFEFSHLYYLRHEELCLLFRTLGLKELALSLTATSKKIAQIVCNRFSVSDARVLAEKIRECRETDPARLQEARYTLLELGGRKLGAEDFLKELGLAVLSKAFTAGDDFLYQALKQKLDPAEGYLLKRYMDVQGQKGDVLGAKRLQGEVLEQIGALSQTGKIDPLWAQYLVAEAA